MKLNLAFFLTFLNFAAIGQLTLTDLKELKFGTTSRDSTYYYAFLNKYDNGKKDYDIMRSDFMSACQISIENFPFENLGSCDSYLLFWKDSLTAGKLTFMFPPKELYKFKPFVSQFLNSFSSNSDLSAVDNPQTKIDIGKVDHVATTECKEQMFPDGRLLGRNYWRFKSSSGKSDVFLIADVSITNGMRKFKRDAFSIEYDEKYQGAWMEVNFVFLNDSSIERYNDMNEIGLGAIGLHTVQKQVDGQIIDFKGSGYGIKRAKSTAINLKDKNQVYFLPIEINGVCTLDFVLDLGASDVSISPDVAFILEKSGTLRKEDFLGEKEYQLADGKIEKRTLINLASVKIGSYEIKDVTASVSTSINAPLLFGQSAMKKLRKYRIDVASNTLYID